MNCDCCGTTFAPRNTLARYCSSKCKSRIARERRRAKITHRILPVTQRNSEPLDRLARAFGVGHISKREEYHRWTCQGREAFAVVGVVWPWLGEQKRSDIKRAFRTLREASLSMRWSMRRPRVIYADLV